MCYKWTILSLLSVICDINGQTMDCNGNCVCPALAAGTTCVLNCNEDDGCKDSELICRSGDPCEVNCIGANSCEGNGLIDGSGSTDVTVNCVGSNACKGNTIIKCGTASCTIECGTRSGCDGTRVDSDTATGLQCTGACDHIPSPFHIPTAYPTLAPTHIPTAIPTHIPTIDPTFVPSVHPTKQPTNRPSSSPTNMPTIYPSIRPSHHPTHDLILVTSASNWTMLSTADNESSDESNDEMRYNNAGLSTNSVYILFIAGTVLIVMSSLLCCFGICVYYSAKKTNVSEEISIAVDRLSSPNPDVPSRNGFNFVPQTIPCAVNSDKKENKTDGDDAKMDEIVNVQNTKDGVADEVEEDDNDNESDSSNTELTSCSLSTNIGDTLRKLKEEDGTKHIKIMDPQRYTWYGYDPTQAGYGVMYGQMPFGAQPTPQFPPCFIPHQNNNVISS